MLFVGCAVSLVTRRKILVVERLGGGLGTLRFPVFVTVLLAHLVNLRLVVVVVRQRAEHLSRF